MKYLKVSLVFLFGIFVLICVVLFFLPQSWTVAGPTGDIEAITIVRRYDLIHWTALLLAISLFTLACISLKVKSVPFRLMLWLLPLVVYPVSWTKSTVSNLGPWTYHGSVSDPAGNSCWFLDSSFLQGQTMAIAKLSERTSLVDRFDVLATTNGDSPKLYLHIVRPNGSQEGYGQLYLNKDNWLVGIRSENRMFLAYDLNSQRAYVRDDAMGLSPFILIDEKTDPNDNDCKQIQQLGIGNEVGQPHEEVILEALNSPNPEVVSCAKALLSHERTRFEKDN
jgi:hypothetical protein